MNDHKNRRFGGSVRGPERRPEEDAVDELRVTDRRRFNADGESTGNEDEVREAPPSQPTELDLQKAARLAAEQKLIEMQQRFDNLRAELQRETDATRQRLNRAADDRARREKAAFIESLLPVIENLYRAIDAADSGAFESLLGGVRTTASGFEQALVAAGVEPIEAIGAQFDPEFHEAVDTLEVDPDRDGIVTAEHSRGYKLGDRLLRPAQVQVGRSAAGRQHGARG